MESLSPSPDYDAHADRASLPSVFSACLAPLLYSATIIDLFAQFWWNSTTRINRKREAISIICQIFDKKVTRLPHSEIVQ